MAMNLGIYNYADLNSASIIDRSVIKEVTENIFANADAKDNSTQEVNFDFSKFNRASLGTDLYSNKVNSEKAIEISKNNAGLDLRLNENFIANIQYLNTQAAKVMAEKNAKVMDGKVQITTEEVDKERMKNNFEIEQMLELVSSNKSNKDKKGSNPFYMGGVKKEKDESGMDNNLPLSYVA